MYFTSTVHKLWLELGLGLGFFLIARICKLLMAMKWIELKLYLMVHSIVLRFEKIWLSHTLKIIRKPKSPYFLREKGP
jgi:hypothetical protein